MVSYGDVRRWDPDGLASASTELRSDLTSLEKACDQVESETVPATWVGLSALTAQWRRSALVTQMSTHVTEAGTFERAIYTASSSVRTLRTTVDILDADARSQQFEISFDGTVSDVSPPQTFESVTAAEHHTDERIRLRDALVERIEAVLKTADEIDQGLLWELPRHSFSDGPGEEDDPTGMGAYSPLTGPVALDDGAFDMSDLRQGQIGDCWFISSAGAVGAHDPGWIRDHIHYNPDGSYTVTLYDQDGDPVDVRVEASVINDGVRGSADGQPSWVSVYEKAAAAYMGGDYDDIDADSIERGLHMVTGRDVDSHGDMNLDDIRRGIDDGRVHVVSTEDDSDSWINPFDTAIDDDNVVPNHAYMVDTVEDHDGDGELDIHLVNPWGPGGGDYDGHHRDGDLWLTQDEFDENFDTTYSVAGS